MSSPLAVRLTRRRRLPSRAALRPELPLVGGQGGRCLLHPAGVLATGEVRPVGAAALHELGRRPGEHALAAPAEDARPVALEEGDVEEPRALLFGVREAHPLVGAGRGPLPRRPSPSARPGRRARARALPSWSSRCRTGHGGERRSALGVGRLGAAEPRLGQPGAIAGTRGERSPGGAGRGGCEGARARQDPRYRPAEGLVGALGLPSLAGGLLGQLARRACRSSRRVSPLRHSQLRCSAS